MVQEIVICVTSYNSAFFHMACVHSHRVWCMISLQFFARYALPIPQSSSYTQVWGRQLRITWRFSSPSTKHLVDENTISLPSTTPSENSPFQLKLIFFLYIFSCWWRMQTQRKSCILYLTMLFGTEVVVTSFGNFRSCEHERELYNVCRVGYRPTTILHLVLTWKQKPFLRYVRW